MKSVLISSLSFAVVLTLDFIWLSLATGPIYRPLMGDLLRTKIDLFPALLFYVLFAFALAFLIILPAITGPVDHVDLTIRAALFGLVCYSTYNLTAQSVITGWSWPLALTDMAWGTFVAAAGANLTVVLGKLLRLI